MAKMTPALARRDLETLGRQFGWSGSKCSPLRNVLVIHKAGDATNEIISRAKELEPKFVIPFATGGRVLQPDGTMMAVFSVNHPIHRSSHWRDDFACICWTPYCLSPGGYLHPDELDYVASEVAMASLMPAVDQAAECLAAVLPVARLPKDLAKVKSPVRWFLAVHELTKSPATYPWGDNFELRIIDDIFQASELAINRLLEAGVDRPPAKLCALLTETELDLLLHLWTNNVASYDELIASVWHGASRSEDTIYRALKGLKEKIEGHSEIFSLKITGKRAIFYRSEE